MPQTCPHCGTELPAVVDAYCPECREDLSATPEEVAAKPTAREVFATATTPFTVPAKEAGATYAVTFTVGSALCLITAVVERDWGFAAFSAVLLAVFGGFLVRIIRVRQVRTSVSGREKTTKSSEQPK